ncbi:GT4 family glycosyltransferase PelF [Chelativorans sp. Marseille-P2723]|uniref:GT4 family glycosyltransferase PelF n=1 Tax=Chelativorans sp. Marseille-P2723 TaxID=2709133 RepID=UPI00156E2961|nr:GT4 family glycosyltransferase PelF [Chelativorans sp. Marseille-P2723]
MSIPAFDLARGKETDVCLIVEGCYPYVLGGVAGWLDWLMRSQPELTFSVVSIVSGKGPRESKYVFPDNLLRFCELDLQGPPPTFRARPFKPGEADVQRVVQILDRFARTGQLEALDDLLHWLRNPQMPPTFHELTQSEFSWRVVTGLYARLMPHASFLDFFWAWHTLIRGLLATAMFPLPRARIYHTISTGYAGLFAARAFLETGHRTILTEHGIYTNERRLEILMADWIVDTVDKGLRLNDPRMDLRDLWIRVFESYARACYEACETVTTLYSDNQTLQVNLGAPRHKLAVIPNGIDLAHFGSVAPPRQDAPPTMAMVGRVVPIKDVKTFIAAAAAVRHAVPGLRAPILGPLDEDPAYFAECRQMVADLGLESIVRFEGRVDVKQWLSSIHVVVLTSLSEAQPLTLLEAGAAGIPCVTTNVGSCREILLGREDEEPAYGAGGIVTDVVAPEQIAEGVIALLTNAQLRQEMGERLQRRVRRFYSSERASNAYRRLYREPAASDGASSWQE